MLEKGVRWGDTEIAVNLSVSHSQVLIWKESLGAVGIGSIAKRTNFSEAQLIGWFM